MGDALSVPSQIEPEKKSPWTPEMVQAILAGLAPLADRFIALKEKEFRHTVQLENAASKAAWSVLAILMAFLALVILLMVWLVSINRVSGDALLFLVGTVSGYILAIVTRHLFPTQVAIEDEGGLL